VHVQKITIVDVNSGMHRLAKKRVATSSIAVEQHIINAELLPFADNSFDHVVSTWTLCSIENIAQALREVRRVLKPKGEFLFVEHGQSPELEVQTWQNRLNPLQRIIGDGCNLNRNIEMLIKEQGFEITHLERFYKDKIFKILGYTYKGIAIKS
jgi:ubiquinone/menaquinone biosynthesis C-methylase UbiE